MKWLRYILNSLFLGGVIFLLAFTNKQQEELACVGMQIELGDESTSLMSRGEMILLLNAVVDSIEGASLKDLPLYEMELSLEQHPLVAEAEVYLTPAGELMVNLSSKEPIMRVKDSQQKQFYVGADGKTFPLSLNYAPRVLLANGHVHDSLAVRQLYQLASRLRQDPFWTAQITQLYMNEQQEIEMIPRVGNHTILFGKAEEMKDKLEKLMLFYERGVSQTSWNKYKLVNLKYKDQLVCVKW